MLNTAAAMRPCFLFPIRPATPGQQPVSRYPIIQDDVRKPLEADDSARVVLLLLVEIPLIDPQLLAEIHAVSLPSKDKVVIHLKEAVGY